MTNNAQETMSYQQRYLKKSKEKYLENCRQYYKEKKRGYKEWLVIDTKYCLRMKKIKKRVW